MEARSRPLECFRLIQPEARMQAEYVNPFVVATIRTFAAMAKMKAEPGKAAAHPSGLCDISGTIDFTGGAEGSISLCFQRASAQLVVAALLRKSQVSAPQVSDGVGELANIVAGAAKRDLSALRLSISLPTVIARQNQALPAAAAVFVPFTIPGGAFDLAVRFHGLT